MPDHSTRLGAIAHWLQQEEDELLYTPDAGCVPLVASVASTSRRVWNIGRWTASVRAVVELHSFFLRQHGCRDPFFLHELPASIRDVIVEPGDFSCRVRFAVDRIRGEQRKPGVVTLGDVPLVEVLEPAAIDWAVGHEMVVIQTHGGAGGYLIDAEFAPALREALAEELAIGEVVRLQAAEALSAGDLVTMDSQGRARPAQSRRGRTSDD